MNIKYLTQKMSQCHTPLIVYIIYCSLCVLFIKTLFFVQLSVTGVTSVTFCNKLTIYQILTTMLGVTFTVTFTVTSVTFLTINQ